MTSEKLCDFTIQVLEDLKGIDIVKLDVKELTTITDYMVVCTGRSTTHVKAMAESLVKKAKENEIKFIKTEGDKGNEWILVDLGDVVVHVMLGHTREFYNLEDFWEPIKEMREQTHS